MTSAHIWIFFPLLCVLALWLIRNYRFAAVTVATSVCLFLALLALLLPMDEVIQVGSVNFEIASTLTILGRRIVLTSGDRPLLIMLYSLGAFWFFGAGIVQTNRYFVPMGFMMIGLLVSALAVEPFLYSAMLFELAVLASIPAAAPPGHQQRTAVMRYLVFQTLALPFILLAGWAAERVEVNPADNFLLSQAFFLLALGFAFWLAIFPFNSWVPRLVVEINPYIAGFILTLIPSVIFLLMLDFINAYSWLRNFPGLSPGLTLIGVIMVVISGMAALFQKNIARLFGYAVLFETGMELAALGLLSESGYQIFLGFFPARIISLAVLSLSIAIIHRVQGSYDYQRLAGTLQKLPFALLALTISLFSISGMPMLGNFSLRFSLFEQLSSTGLIPVVMLLTGSLLFFTGALRAISFLSLKVPVNAMRYEGFREISLLSVGALVLLILGVLPNTIIPSLFSLLDVFDKLF